MWRLGLLPSRDFGDFALLFLFGLDLLPLQHEDRLAGFDVLLLDRLFLFAADFVGENVFPRGQFGDLLDALGVKNVLRVHHLQRRLLEIVDGTVVQLVAVQVGADDLDDLFLELVPLLVQFGEVKPFADGLQRLGELGVKQFDEGLLLRGAPAAQRLGHLQDVFPRVVDADEEGDFDVCPHVVLADQTLFALAVDLDPLDRQVHLFPAMDHRDDHDAGAGGGLQAAVAGADNGLFRSHLAVESRGQQGDGQTAEHDGRNAHASDEQQFFVDSKQHFSRHVYTSGCIFSTK